MFIVLLNFCVRGGWFVLHASFTIDYCLLAWHASDWECGNWPFCLASCLEALKWLDGQLFHLIQWVYPHMCGDSGPPCKEFFSCVDYVGSMCVAFSEFLLNCVGCRHMLGMLQVD